MGFLFSQTAFRHLFIFGEAGTGRTTLAVAIATERTFAVRSARYLSWARFVEHAEQNPEPLIQDGMYVWPWRDSDIVVLDDVAVSTPIQKIVADLERLPVVRRQLAAQQTVWVLGPQPDGWAAALAGALNVTREDEEYCVVQLRRLPGYQKPKRPFSHFSGV